MTTAGTDRARAGRHRLTSASASEKNVASSARAKPIPNGASEVVGGARDVGSATHAEAPQRLSPRARRTNLGLMRVEQKWGFGMAPIKPDVQNRRRASAEAVYNTLLNEGAVEVATPEQFSDRKGLFTRCWKQDQWDWFTVWQQLGRPGTNRARVISYELKDLRDALIRHEPEVIATTAAELRKSGADHFLDTFVQGRRVASSGLGYIYILSTRENRDLLKIGYTERSVEERVSEINSSTGVAVPFGVRAMWVVKEARIVEAEIHSALVEYRVRKDREFFNVDFRKAFRIVSDLVYRQRLEL